jgi:hypothetical protein
MTSSDAPLEGFRGRPWQAAAAALAVAFVVLLPVAMTSVWIRGTVLSTSGYVATVAPVAQSPVVRAAVQEMVTTEVDNALKHLPGPLRDGLAGLAGDGVSTFMASAALQSLWVTVNSFAHSQLISVLDGDSTVVATTGGQVVLNLIPVVNGVLNSVSGRLSALTGGAVTLPPVKTIPAAVCHALAGISHGPSSAACGQIPLFPASTLAGPRLVFRALTYGTALVLVLTPLAFAGALAATRRKRRTLLQMTIGGTLALLAVLVGLSMLESSLINHGAPHYQAVTSVVVHALTNGFFTVTTWFVAAGFAVTAVTLLAGPYRWAAIARNALRFGSAPGRMRSVVTGIGTKRSR